MDQSNFDFKCQDSRPKFKYKLVSLHRAAAIQLEALKASKHYKIDKPLAKITISYLDNSIKWIVVHPVLLL